jgi:putative RNA 2'-phosphotransferase
MDCHGWVPIEELINRINQRAKYHISGKVLQEIVANDKKGRYRFSQDQTKIKACQGHSISWVEPELEYTAPPPVLYHGTTWSAYQDICKSGAINRMGRHAVHLTAVESRAWQSARRRKTRAVVLKIDAEEMHKQGFIFGMSENEVWCTDTVPIRFVAGVLGEDGRGGSKLIG